jgi:catechol 2,3-dioxygenase-like lactoylglutathione lyase family enzyme
MAVQLNHTIVAARDRDASAQFLADILGLPAPVQWGPFTIVEDANGTSLDFMDWGDHEIATQHYAFLVSDEEFDAAFGRIRERGLPYWADPHQDTPNEINHNDGGRGVYFEDPNGHLLELITKPYGSGA